MDAPFGTASKTKTGSLRMHEVKRQSIVVAVSGGGRSLANLLALEALPSTRFQVKGVIASNPECGGVKIAESAQLPVFVGRFSQKSLPSEAAALQIWLEAINPQLIVLAGFLKVFPILAPWAKSIINIHPALLPKHGGKGMFGDRVHAAVLDAKEQVSGATTHFVTEKYDEGPIIAQIEVPVLPQDQVSDLATRVFAAECQLLPLTINKLIDATYPVPSDSFWRFHDHFHGN
jgi:phosphoribosylglycinamide formyltransferase 1